MTIVIAGRYSRPMQFDIIQTLSLAGKASVANDDRAGAIGALGWVIDGATDLGRAGLVGTRGGAAWLAMEADAALAAAADQPLADVCVAMIDRVADRYDACRQRDPLGRWELPSASFLAVRVANGAIDCAWLGDCAALLGQGETMVRLGPAADRGHEAAQAADLAVHAAGGVEAAPVLASLRQARERPGRRVLGVERVAARHAARTPCAIGDDVLLMSDGFAALSDVYGELDEAGLMAAVRADGLAALAVRLRAIERDDAEYRRFPRFKLSDDATALWLRVSG